MQKQEKRDPIPSLWVYKYKLNNLNISNDALLQFYSLLLTYTLLGELKVKHNILYNSKTVNPSTGVFVRV